MDIFIRLNRIKIGRVSCLIFFLLICGSCAIIKITSDPPGAEIYYSQEMGQRMYWKPWRPDGEGNAAITPSTALTFKKGFYFLRVHREGYYEPQPQLVELLPFKVTKVKMGLQETSSHFAERQTKKGLVLYKNEWVDPEKEGLVFYNDQWMTQQEFLAADLREKGLVFYRDRWMPPEEKQKLVLQEYSEKGLIQYKGRWIEKEEYNTQKNIDETVAKITLTTGTFQIPQPKLVGSIRGEKAKMRLFNGTGYTINIFISGPDSQKISVEGYDAGVALLGPGNYTIAVEQIQDKSVIEGPDKFYGYVKMPIKPSSQYSLSYEGKGTELPVTSDKVDEFIKEKFEIPTIEVPISDEEIQKLRKPQEDPGQQRRRGPPRQ
jgi:hypothetical protein